MSMFSTTLNGRQDNEQKCETRSNSSFVIGVLCCRTRKSMVTLVLEQSERSTGSDCQTNGTDIWRSFACSIFFCAELCSKGGLKSKEVKQTIHFQRTTQTNMIIIRTLLACNQLCIYAAVCDYFDRYNRSGTFSTDDLTNLTEKI